MSMLIETATQRTNDATQTRGVVFVHACTRALSPHLEWAVGQVLQREVSMAWTPQPVLPGAVRAEYPWHAEAGTAARIVSALRSFTGLRYEVTQEPCSGHEGERFSITPGLGIFRATVGLHGDIQVGEDRLRTAMATAARQGTSLRDELDAVLGTAWDVELEPFRYAGDGAQVRYLHRVG